MADPHGILRAVLYPFRLVLAALTSFVLAACLWLVVLQTKVGRQWDSDAVGGFTGFHSSRVKHGADAFAHLADPLPFAVLTAAVALIALVQRRWLLALLVPVALVGANVTTQALKDLISSARFSKWLGVHDQIPVSAWPSGHSTAAISLALGMVLVVPAVTRPVVAILGAAFAIGVGFSVTLLGWHYPSDVLGGFLIAAGWALLALAVYAVARRNRPDAVQTRPKSILVHPVVATVLAVVVGVGLAAVIVRPDAVRFYAGTQTSFFVAAFAIAALGALVVIGIAALRDRVT